MNKGNNTVNCLVQLIKIPLSSLRTTQMQGSGKVALAIGGVARQAQVETGLLEYIAASLWPGWILHG